MKNLFPTNPTNEILNPSYEVNKEKRILIFTPLTKEEHDAFTQFIQYYNTFPRTSNKRNVLNDELFKEVNFNISDIVAIGDTKIETRLANFYIENIVISMDKVSKRNYKCFVNKNWRTIGQMNLPYHDDGGCSWNCLMQKLKNPKYGIIYGITNTMKSKFIKDERN